MSIRSSTIANELNQNVEMASRVSSKSRRLEEGSEDFKTNTRNLTAKMRRQQEQGVVRGAAHYLLKRIRRLRGINQRGGKKRTLRKKSNKRKTKKGNRK
jgi:hypothetical protein